MARVNVYLPDDLADRARAAGVNISAATRSALEEELSRRAGEAWLDQAAGLSLVDVPADEVLAAVDAARDKLAGDEPSGDDPDADPGVRVG